MLVYEDALWAQGSNGDLVLNELGIHLDELLNKDVATTCHCAPLSQHISQTVLLACHLEAEPIIG